MSAPIKLSRRTAEELLRLCEENFASGLPVIELRAALRRKPLKRFVKLARDRKTLKRETTRAQTAKVRKAVAKRAPLICECGCRRWFRGFDGAATVDHFWGIAREESLESCWRLRAGCHRAKTDNRPSRAFWLSRFAEHATEFGYLEQAEKAQRELESIELMAASTSAGELARLREAAPEVAP